MSSLRHRHFQVSMKWLCCQGRECSLVKHPEGLAVTICHAHPGNIIHLPSSEKSIVLHDIFLLLLVYYPLCRNIFKR